MKCPECQKEFPSSSSVRLHMKRMHGKKMPKYSKAQLQCPACDFQGAAYGSLHKHVHAHPGFENWRLGDPTPGSANGANGANGANRIPAGPGVIVKWKNRKTPCPECGQTGFKRATVFGAHRKFKHGVMGTSASVKSKQRQANSPRAGKGGKVECPECPRTFKTPLALSVHRRFAHGVAGQFSGGRSGSNNRARRVKAARRTARGVLEIPHHPERVERPELEVADIPHVVHYCPVCRTDLRLIQKALDLQR